MTTLSACEQSVLEFEKQWWRFEGAKQRAIREQLHLTPTRYYQILNQLVDNPDALRSEPVVVRRLQRQRQSRREAYARQA